LSGGASVRSFEKYERERAKIESKARLEELELSLREIRQAEMDNKRQLNDAIISEDKVLQDSLLSNARTLNDEKIALEAELRDARIEGEREVAEERKRRFDEIVKTAYDIMDAISTVYQSIIQLERTNLEARRDSEMRNLDTVYNARLKAAEGDSEEQERLQQELSEKREIIDKRAAEGRRQIALKEARVQMALNIIKNLSNPFAAIAAGIAGAIQLQIIRATKYAGGGFTTAMGKKDETGKRVAGIVHEDEYVAPDYQVKKYRPLFEMLDSERTKKFAVGGFTSRMSGSSGGSTLNVAMSDEVMGMFAKVVSEEVGKRVMEGSMQGSMMGGKEGLREGLTVVSNERLSKEITKIFS
jgi:hypothetical protein